MQKNPLLIWLPLMLSAVLAGGQQVAPSRPLSGASLYSEPENQFGRLPLIFEANLGQTAEEARFIVRGKGYSAFMTSSGIVLSLRSEVRSEGMDPAYQAQPQRASASLNFVGATPNPIIQGEDPQPGHLNYFIGNNRSRWRTNVPMYSKVRYKNVYSGIDLVYYGNRQQLEYDFEVSPYANPNLIQFEIKGASSVQLADDGSLTLKVQGNEIHLQNPTVYQQVNGQRMVADGGYVLMDATHVGFRLSNYDPSKPLVIDPVLSYCTYLGGSGDDEAQAITIDSSGAVYVTGTTDSPDFPGTLPTAFNGQDVFVAKLDPTGAHLVYADYLGGTSTNAGSALTLDSTNNVYVTGYTSSSDFPTVTPLQATLAGSSDAFISELSSDGSQLLYSSFLGGSNYDAPVGVALDNTGNLFVAGWTMSTDFPVSANAYQGSVSPNGGGQYGVYGFLVKLNPGFQTVSYSTYLGGSAQVAQPSPNGPYWSSPSSAIVGLALDSTGAAYVAGVTDTSDFPATAGAYISSYSSPVNIPVGFVSKFNAIGGLSYSSFLYGSDGAETSISAIAVDSSGSAYVTGATSSGATFPLTATSICDPGVNGSACNYAFITKFNELGSGLTYSTFLGPNNQFSPASIALDGNNDAYVIGVNYTGMFAPVNGIENYPSPAASALLLVEIDPTASSQLFATYFGGATAGAQSAGLTVDVSGNIYAAGVTSATDLPTTPEAYQMGLSSAIGLRASSNSGLTVDGSGKIYAAGVTSATDLPTISEAYQMGLSSATGLRPTRKAYQVSKAGKSDAFLFEISPTVAPGFAASPGFVQFPLQPVGQTSQPQSVLLRNMGSSPLSISSVTTTGDFSQTNDCSDSVAAASSCTLTVSFAPMAPGIRSGTIVIQDNSAGSPHLVNLLGDALGSQLLLSPANLNFSDLPVGSPSSPQTVTLINTGNIALSINNTQISGDYSQTTNCPTTLVSGGTCQFQIVFTPTTTGVQAGNLTVIGDSFNSPQSIALNGTGVDFTLSSSASNISVMPGTSATYNLNLAPIGGSFANPIQLSCNGVPAGAICNFSHSRVNLGAKAALVTLTISTNGATTNVTPRSSDRHFAIATLLGFQGVGLLGLLFVVPQRRYRKAWVAMLSPFLILLLLFTSACAGGTGTVSQKQIGTPAGSYEITVTANSGILKHSLRLGLSVQ
jgi:hypothetical protein